MVNDQQKITPNHLDLFSHLEQCTLETQNAPSLDLELELCAAVKAAIYACPYSRDQVVDRMNLCLRDSNAKNVTKRRLDHWLAPSQSDNHFPFHYVPALCWATQSILPVQRLLMPLGHEAVDVRDKEVLEYGQLEVEKSRLIRQMNKMKKRF